MSSAPLLITSEVKANLHQLREEAAARPMDVIEIMKMIKTPEGMERHLARVREQMIEIPGPCVYQVGYSVESGHPAGLCRHVSVVIDRLGRAPSPAAVWMIACELGFAGGIRDCRSWIDKLNDGHFVINLAQPMAS